jgi:hypothetical protein
LYPGAQESAERIRKVKAGDKNDGVDQLVELQVDLLLPAEHYRLPVSGLHPGWQDTR